MPRRRPGAYLLGRVDRVTSGASLPGVRESRSDKAARANAIVDRLSPAYPEARIALQFNDPYELLVAVVLSAQCTDKRVNEITPKLFARYPTVSHLAGANRDELEEIIRPCGLFRSKAKSLTEASRAIRSRYGGQVPTSRAALATLPGIGNKSAGVISMQLSDEAALPVDTHVARLAFRLGLSTERDPDKIERDLRALLPRARWKAAHHLLVWHGRRICLARAPQCPECPVASLCPKLGVELGGRRRPRPANKRS